MEEEHYNAEGTGMLIMDALTKLNTLGLTRSWLANILVHFSYDGVYAIKEQRTSIGGSLDFPNYVSLALILPKNTLIGTWDYSHNLQIIWNNIK